MSDTPVEPVVEEQPVVEEPEVNTITIECPECGNGVEIMTPDARQLESVRPIWSGSALGNPDDFVPYVTIKCTHCETVFTKEF